MCLRTSALTIPQSSWSSPDPCIYAKPCVRLSTPSWIVFDAETQMIDIYGVEGLPLEEAPEVDWRGTEGKVRVAGVIHRGRKGQGRSGRVYEDV